MLKYITAKRDGIFASGRTAPQRTGGGLPRPPTGERTNRVAGTEAKMPGLAPPPKKPICWKRGREKPRHARRWHACTQAKLTITKCGAIIDGRGAQNAEACMPVAGMHAGE